MNLTELIFATAHSNNPIRWPGFSQESLDEERKFTSIKYLKEYLTRMNQQYKDI
jgi:hypothetical protein